MHKDPFTAIIVLLFSLASWRDGSIWASGVCFGIGIAMMIAYVDRKIVH